MAHYISSAFAGFGGKPGELENYAEWAYSFVGMKYILKITVSEVE